jgi:hypothetical protein
VLVAYFRIGLSLGVSLAAASPWILLLALGLFGCFIDPEGGKPDPNEGRLTEEEKQQVIQDYYAMKRRGEEYRLDTHGSFDLVGYCSNAAVLYAVTHLDEGDEDQLTDDFSDGCLSV